MREVPAQEKDTMTQYLLSVHSVDGEPSEAGKAGKAGKPMTDEQMRQTY
jgi:hypothetical protein